MSSSYIHKNNSFGSPIFVNVMENDKFLRFYFFDILEKVPTDGIEK